MFPTEVLELVDFVGPIQLHLVGHRRMVDKTRLGVNYRSGTERTTERILEYPTKLLIEYCKLDPLF